MSTAERETLAKIHKVAEQEFLQKGFKGASLRIIVKEAGVTTGAFYGYYKSKEELFDALVSPHANYILNYYDDVKASFDSLSKEEQIKVMSGYGKTYMEDVLKYSYEHLSGIKLLLLSSSGTKYEDFTHQMVEKEIQGKYDFAEAMKQMGMHVPTFNPRFEHTITSGMFNSYFELIIHDVPYEEAKECAQSIYQFYSAGWEACMGLV